MSADTAGQGYDDDAGYDPDGAYHQGHTDGYGRGYAEGKGKAHAEVRRWRPGRHFRGCQCDVCLTARAVLTAFSEYADAELAAGADGIGGRHRRTLWPDTWAAVLRSGNRFTAGGARRLENPAPGRRLLPPVPFATIRVTAAAPSQALIRRRHR